VGLNNSRYGHGSVMSRHRPHNVTNPETQPNPVVLAWLGGLHIDGEFITHFSVHT